MVQENLDLAGKMDDWGPFGPKEGQWLIFSLGNPEEGHGYALPRMIDDLASKYFAQTLALKSGQRYVAHIPYTTDHCGDIAKHWAPRYIPFPEFLEKTKEFLAFHLDIYRDMGLPASKVLIFSAHGGNDDLAKHQEELKSELKLSDVIVVTGDFANSQIQRVLQAVEELGEKLVAEGERFEGQDPDDVAFLLTQVLTTAGHADHFEHSIGAALGVVDWDKLKIMNDALVQDFEAALHKWPPIGGLGGFLLAGGDYTTPEAAGSKEKDPHGLWNCLRGLREVEGGKLVVIPELGRMLLDLATDFLAEMLLEKCD